MVETPNKLYFSFYLFPGFGDKVSAIFKKQIGSLYCYPVIQDVTNTLLSNVKKYSWKLSGLVVLLVFLFPDFFLSVYILPLFPLHYSCLFTTTIICINPLSLSWLFGLWNKLLKITVKIFWCKTVVNNI